jgi:hypothetical protein
MAEGAPSPQPGRRWLIAASGLGGRTALWLALVVAGIAAADRARATLDLSADRRFTLSPELVSLIDAQREPTELVGIWGDGEADRFALLERQLEAIAARNRRLSWRRIDPELRKPALDDFAAHHRGARTRGIYVCRGERAIAIPLSEWTRVVLQREVGGALVALAEARPPRALLTQGHGELRPGAPPSDGGAELMHALELGGFTVDVLADPAGDLPPDALLVVAGPIGPAAGGALFGERWLETLRRHLRDGGSLLLLGDDRLPPDLGAELRARGILGTWGVPKAFEEHGDRLALLDGAAALGRPTVIYAMERCVTLEGAVRNANLLLGDAAGATINVTHPATSAAATSGVDVVSPRTAGIEVFPPQWLASQDADAAKRFADSGLAPRDASILLRTLPGDAWTQPFSDALMVPPGREQGDARALAWAVEYAPQAGSVLAAQGGARLALWGSRQAASDAVLGQAQYGDAALLRSLAAWLARRTPPTAIPEAETRAYQVALSDNGLFLLLGALVVVVPFLFIGAAMLTWWDRR